MTDQNARLWLIWAGLVLAMVIILPFLLRQESFLVSAWAYCLTLIGPS